MTYSIADINGSFTSATTATATATATTKHTLTTLDDIDMSSYTGPSTMVLVHLARDSTDATDTFTGDAHLLEFDIHYKVGSLGSSAVSVAGP